MSEEMAIQYQRGYIDGFQDGRITFELRTGYWICIDEEPHEDYECDNCGFVLSTWTANIKPHEVYKFCPNCGAKMFKPMEKEEEDVI